MLLKNVGKLYEPDDGSGDVNNAGSEADGNSGDTSQEETPEKKLERVEKELVTLEEEKKSYSEEKSRIGRINKELISEQQRTQKQIETLTDSVSQLTARAPKTEEDSYLDLTDRDKADVWFDGKVVEYERKSTETDNKYEREYKSEIAAILDDSELDDNGKSLLLSHLQTHKEKGVARRSGNVTEDADRNYERAEKAYWKDLASGNLKKTVNLKGDKAIGTGVGGTGTQTTTAKTVQDTPAMASLRKSLASAAKLRGRA